MSKNDLGNAIQQATSEFAQAVIRAIRESSLQELMGLQGKPAGTKAPAKPVRKKQEAGKPRGKKQGNTPKAAKKHAKKAEKKAEAAPKKTQTKKRISGDEKKALLDSIVTFLEKNPASKGPAVASAMGLKMQNARVYLKELRDAGLVTAEGDKVKMVYFAVVGR